LESIVDEEVCWGKFPSYECLQGEGDSIIYFMGDSQLSKIAKQLSSKNKTYSYFFNIEPFGLDFYDRYYSEKCTDCLKDFLNIDKKEKIIIFNARIPHYLQENYFDNGLYTTTSKVYKTYPKNYIIEDLNSLIDYSDLFILIYPIPEHAWNVRDLILNKKFSVPDSDIVVSYEKKYWDEYSRDAINLLDSLQSNKIRRVYPSKIFCENFKPNKCVGEFNNEYFYVDNIHLSSSGAELIVEKIEQILLED